MATSEILDFAALVAPISGENPAGVNLREDAAPNSLYQEVKFACSQARTADRKQEADRSAPPADWSPVLSLVPKALCEKSKDTELAFWLLEALTHRHGFAGMRDGCRLIRQLAEEYWDKGLYPVPSPDEGPRVRFRMLEALNGREERVGLLVRPINKVHLTEGADGGPYSRSDLLRALDLESIPDPEKRAQRIEKEGVSVERFLKAVAASPTSFYRDLKEDLDQCISELDKLVSLIEAKSGNDKEGRSAAPSTSAIREALGECLKILEEHAKDKLASGKKEGDGSGGGQGQAGGTQATQLKGDALSLSGQMPVREELIEKVKLSRKEAVGELRRLARFFKETEPHSPISYALERIAQWSEMPLPDLLSEIIAEEGTRGSVFKLVGIKPPAPEQPK